MRISLPFLLQGRRGSAGKPSYVLAMEPIPVAITTAAEQAAAIATTAAEQADRFSSAPTYAALQKSS